MDPHWDWLTWPKDQHKQYNLTPKKSYDNVKAKQTKSVGFSWTHKMANVSIKCLNWENDNDDNYPFILLWAFLRWECLVSRPSITSGHACSLECPALIGVFSTFQYPSGSAASGLKHPGLLHLILKLNSSESFTQIKNSAFILKS